MTHTAAHLTEALLAGDTEAVRGSLTADGTVMITPEYLDGTLTTALAKIGDSWEGGTVSLSEIFLSAKTANAATSTLLTENFRPEQLSICVATFNDTHVLGKQIVVDLLHALGYTLTDLGICADVDEVVASAVREDPDILVLSVLMLRSALGIRQVRNRLAVEGLFPIIVVGGAPFRIDPDLGLEVGAHYVGRTASDVLKIMNTVQEELC